MASSMRALNVTATRPPGSPAFKARSRPETCKEGRAYLRRTVMADEQKSDQVSREQLIELLNEDLAREYQAIIAYVVYSQMLKGAEYMAIAKELEKHAGEELQHALTVVEARRLSRRRTDRHCQASEDVGEGRGHASVRPGQRERDGAELSRAREAMRGARRVSRWQSICARS